MTTKTTLFAQILPMFTGQTERAATEALRHILVQSEAARDALGQLLSTAGVEVGSLTRFRTEASVKDNERVDLVCYDGSNAARVFIEAKFRAELTDNQPNTYLEGLPETGHSALLFIVPARRMGTLWQEVCSRAQIGHELAMRSTTGDLWNVTANGNGRKMMMISWRDLLQFMITQASTDEKAVSDIRQLLGLTDRMDNEVFLPIQPEEISPEIPQRIRSLPPLVDAAIERMKGLGWLRPDNKRPTIDDTINYYGRMMDFAGTRAWFGVNLEYWAQRRNTPVCIEVYSSEQLPDSEDSYRLLSKISQTFPDTDVDAEDWHIPIFLPVGVEYNTVVDEVVKRLLAIAHLIDPNGPTYKD